MEQDPSPAGPEHPNRVPLLGGRSTPGGVLTPLHPVPPPAPEHPATSYAHTYFSYTELGGDPIDEAEIIELLRSMSAYDVLVAVAHISCMVHTAPLANQ